jgi:hypothetical protein
MYTHRLQPPFDKSNPKFVARLRNRMTVAHLKMVRVLLRNRTSLLKCTATSEIQINLFWDLNMFCPPGYTIVTTNVRAVTFLILSATSTFYHPEGPYWPLSTISPLVPRLALTVVVLFGVVCQFSLFAMYGRHAVAAGK